MSDMTAGETASKGQAGSVFSVAPWPAIRKSCEILGWLAVLVLLYTGLTSIFSRADFLQTAYEQGVTDGMATFNPFDGRYFEHDVATWLHLIPAFIIYGFGPLQFIRPIRKNYLNFHRWSGRIWLICGFAAALSGSFIGVFYPFMEIEGQGFNESMATLAFGLFSMFCLAKAYYHIRHRNIGLHREWMIRSWAMMLAVATERVFLGIFMASTDIGVEVLFGTTFWMAGVINLAVGESWISLTRTPGNGARHWKDLDAKAAS